MDIQINWPLKKVYSSKNYALMIKDNKGVTHYWNPDGSYDGHSRDYKPHIDKKT